MHSFSRYAELMFLATIVRHPIGWAHDAAGCIAIAAVSSEVIEAGKEVTCTMRFGCQRCL